MAPLISQRSFAPFPFLFLFFSAVLYAGEGRDLYLKNCSLCHHEERIGRTAPPLLPQILKGKSDRRLAEIIRKGIPNTSMPAFKDLKDEEVSKIVEFLRRPASQVVFGLEDIERSRESLPKEGTAVKSGDPLNTVVLIDRGYNRVLLIEGKKVLDSFTARSVHGGVKFAPDLSVFYVPSREGWIYSYSLKDRRPLLRVRSCLYMRNISLSGDGGFIGALCVLPPSLVILSKDLKPLRAIPLKGRPSGVYFLRNRGKFLVAFRDRAFLGFADPRGGYEERQIDHSLPAFTVDPFEGYLIGGSADGRQMVVYDLLTLRKVFSVSVPSLPHLFAGSFWYRKGDFYFATRHRNSDTVTIIRLYRWKLIAQIKTGSVGYFVRTAPFTPFLWVDSEGPFYLLINKDTLKLRRVRISSSGRATHVEFSADGKTAYLSVIGKEPGLYLLDPATLERRGFIRSIHPAGKYSPLFKVPRLRTSTLGREVYMEKCWGCHNLRRDAFGPAFGRIAMRLSTEAILNRLENPPPNMPAFRLTDQEKSALASLFEFMRERAAYAESE